MYIKQHTIIKALSQDYTLAELRHILTSVVDSDHLYSIHQSFHICPTFCQPPTNVELLYKQQHECNVLSFAILYFDETQSSFWGYLLDSPDLPSGLFILANLYFYLFHAFNTTNSIFPKYHSRIYKTHVWHHILLTDEINVANFTSDGSVCIVSSIELSVLE